MFQLLSQVLHSQRKVAKERQVVWDTTQFNDKNDWPADGSQPFHLSTGDNTGYGQHGDYGNISSCTSPTFKSTC